MDPVVTGKAYVLGDNIDTDQIIPAQYLKLSTTDPEERKFFGMYALTSVPEGMRGLPDGNIPFVREKLDENGRLKPNEIMEQAAEAMLGELARYAEALRSLRST